MPVAQASSLLNLGLDQAANYSDPVVNNELQGIHNALHTLNAYMDELRKEYEGSDSQSPDVSLRFRRRIKGIALQPIQAGNIVSPYPGGFVNGCDVSTPSEGPTISRLIDSSRQWKPITITREAMGLSMTAANVALTSAAAGEEVTVGVDTGVIKVSGFTPGQIVYAAGNVSYSGLSGATNGNGPVAVLAGVSLLGDGALYASSGGGYIDLGPGAGYYTEGYFVGAPYRTGDYWFSQVRHHHPVGICIAPDFVMICDYVRQGYPTP